MRVQPDNRLETRWNWAVERFMVKGAYPVVVRLWPTGCLGVCCNISDERRISPNRVTPNDVWRTVKEHSNSASNTQLALLGWIPGKTQPGSKIGNSVGPKEVRNNSNGSI